MTGAALLLDTHVAIWKRGAPDRLLAAERAAIAAADRLFVSAATIWEIAGLVGLGRLPPDPDLVTPEEGVELLPIAPPHCRELARLPRVHRDPFDRMLIAQARVEGLVLVTRDRAIHAYGAEGAEVLPAQPEARP